MLPLIDRIQYNREYIFFFFFNHPMCTPIYFINTTNLSITMIHECYFVEGAIKISILVSKGKKKTFQYGPKEVQWSLRCVQSPTPKLLKKRMKRKKNEHTARLDRT